MWTVDENTCGRRSVPKKLHIFHGCNAMLGEGALQAEEPGCIDVVQTESVQRREAEELANKYRFSVIGNHQWLDNKVLIAKTY